MSRLFDIAMAIMSWEHNHVRQINECLDKGCPPGLVADIRKELHHVVRVADSTLTKSESDWLVNFELKGELE